MVMMRVCMTVAPAGGNTESSAFPYLVYVVPNALFPLMAFFLWLSLSYYKPYISLYTVGKIIAVVSVIGWSVLSFQTILTSLMQGTAGIVTAGATFMLAAGDVFSIVGGLMLQNKVHHFESLTARPLATLAETTAPEQGGIA